MSLRRQGFATFDKIWQYIARGPEKGVLPHSVPSEVLLACALSPLLYADMRCEVSGVVGASDASKWAGGVSVTRGSRTAVPP